MSEKFDEFEFDENLLDDTQPDPAAAAQSQQQAEDTAARTDAKKKPGLISLDPKEMLARIKAAPVLYIGATVFILFALYMLYNVLFGWNNVQPKHQAQTQAQQQHVGLGMSLNQARVQHVPSQLSVQKPVAKSASNHAVTASPNSNYVSMTKKDMEALLHGFAQTTQKQTAQLAKHLATLQQAVGAQGKTSQNLQQQVNQVAQEQTQLVTALKHSAKDMKSISNALNQTKSQLQLLIAERAAHAEKLTLRAVVPGRAWLVNGKWRTTTVTVGMDLGSYGKVVKIDSDHDKVYMSSGYVFS